MHKTKWFVIVNPAAGNGKGKKHWPGIQVLLKKAGVDYESAVSSYAGHSIVLAEEAVQRGFKYIAAVGGDGTVNEVINGMCNQQVFPSEELIFAIIPIGTGNDWIKTHKIPKNYKKAIRLLNLGNKKTHDVGKVFYHTEDGIQKHRYFVNVAGLAYDAYVTKATKVRPKWGNSRLYYFYLILSCVKDFRPTKAKVIFDGQELEYDFYNITVGQCIYNGGGTQLVPHADPQDGLFALTMFKNIEPWEVIVKAHKFYNGSIVKHKEAFTTQAKHIRIEAPQETPAFVEVDGEYLGQSPIEFVMKEHAVNIIVP
jgi:diacylglycerol kinase (ATP)